MTAPPDDLPAPITVADYEERARSVLPAMAFDYYAGGA